MGVPKTRQFYPPQNERMHPQIERRELQNERMEPKNESGNMLLERFNKLNVEAHKEEVNLYICLDFLILFLII